MTYALCFSCGNTKFGALVPCRECGAPASGNVDMDIAFSDHVIKLPTIEAFGAVLKALRGVCDDEDLRSWAFIRYLSVHHPDILRVELSEAEERTFDEILSRTPLPVVTILRSEESQKYRDQRAQGGETDA